MSRMYDNPQFIGGKYSTDTSPIDDRFVVQTQADLFLEATWQDRGLYKGLFTVVTSDSTPDNNGMYVLKNPNYRDKQSWDSSSAETYSPNGWFRVGAVMDTFLSGVTVMKGTDINDYNTAHNTNYDTTKVYLKFVFTTKPDGMTPVQQDIVVDVSDFYDSTDAFLWVTFSKAAHSNGSMTCNKSYSQIETAINDGKLVIGEYQPNVQGYPKQYFMIPVHTNSSTLMFANMSPNTANEVLYISVTSSAVTLDIQKDYAIPDVANNDGKVLTANATNDAVEWTTMPTLPTFNEGLGVNIETNTTNNTVTISAESNHTVIDKQIVVSSQPGETLEYYTVLCDLNGVTVKLVDIDDVVTSEYAVPYENHYRWEKQANESDKYIGLCNINSTVGKYVFKLDVNNTDTNELNIYYYCLLCDSPSDSTFTFVSTNQWEIIVRLDESHWTLYAYLKVPNEFVGTVTLTPLRGNDINNLYKIWSFDYATGTTLRKYRWRDEVLGGTQSLDLLTELIGSESQSTDSTAPNFLRSPGGNYYVNIIGSFGGDLNIGSRIADNIVNDFFIHNLDQRLTATNSAISQADWNQTTISAPDYIKNKPTIPTVRTMNHEQLTDSTLGDINIHDGFYFPNAVQDADGNWYGAVVIGDQVWMAENYRCTKLPNGTQIVNASASANNGAKLFSTNTPYYYWYNDSEATVAEQGLLYNISAFMNGSTDSATSPSGVQGIAPDGWHVPSCAEFIQFTDYVSKQQRFLANKVTYQEEVFDDIQTLSLHAKSLFTSSDIASLTEDESNSINATGFNIRSGSGEAYFLTTDEHIIGNGDEVSTNCSISFYHVGGNVTKAGSMITPCSTISLHDTHTEYVDDGPNSAGAWVRCVSNLTPVQFRNWYVETYGSMQHHLGQENGDVVITRINSSTFSCNKTSLDFYNMYLKGIKPIFYVTNKANTYFKGPCVASYGVLNFINDNFIVSYELYCYDDDIHYDKYDVSFTGVPSDNATVDVGYESLRYYTHPTTRTVNGESLFEKSLVGKGDIKIYDGFFFPNAIQDYDGNWYDAVVIGEQVWLAENLRTSHYTDGTAISPMAPGVATYHNDYPAYANEESSSIPLKYRGYKYNICTCQTNNNGTLLLSGWHVPSSTEWDTLLNYVYQQERYNETKFKKLVARSLMSTNYWTITYPHEDSGVAINATGFNAIPTGRDKEMPNQVGISCSFFTSNAYTYSYPGADVNYTETGFGIYDWASAMYASSIRCVSDLTPIQFRNWYIEQYGSLQHHLPEEVQAQADWNQTTISAPDFIKNKPDLSSFITLNDVPKEIVWCTYTETNSVNHTGTMSMTVAELEDAVQAGNVVCLRQGDAVYTLTFKGESPMFVCVQGTTIRRLAYFISDQLWHYFVNTLQPELVSGTNIKTINNTSILGSGNISTAELPAVTASDNGKILLVDNGAWAASAVPVADNTLF